MLDPITQGHLDRGVERLVDEFRGVFSRETIQRFVADSLEGLPAARISDFVRCRGCGLGWLYHGPIRSPYPHSDTSACGRACTRKPVISVK